MVDAQDPALSAGTVVGGFRIEYPIGGGGMGTVYAAEEPTIRKRVAIKVLRRAYADDARIAARFEREARAVNDVSHPGIVDVFAFGKLEDGRPYLVMSLLVGRSLREELEARGKLPIEEAWRIGREVAEALVAAHEAGIVHRDLKPDNVFLERAGGAAPRARILDFGLAQVDESLTGDALTKLTQTGVPMGTPRYMAPEQWWSQPTSGATDQYAFGGMLFEMLTGRPPFETGQYVELLQMHLNQAPPTLRGCGVASSPRLEAFFARLLAKKAEERFASMSEVLEEGDRAFTEPTQEPGPSDADALGHAATVLAPVTAEELELASAPSLARSGSGVGASSGAPALTPDLRSLPPIHRPLRRFAAAFVAVTCASAASISLVGYAGESRYVGSDIFKMAGWGAPATLAWFLVSLIVLAYQGVRRARSGTPRRLPWVLTLLTLLSGAAGTYTGWVVVNEATLKEPINDRLVFWNIGMYEANCSRFMGLCAVIPLLVILAAIPGVSGMVDATLSRVGPAGASRRELHISAAVSLVLLVAGVALGAPSAALVAGTALACSLVSAALPTVHREHAARDELERALASILAVAAAIGAGYARIESRGAHAWWNADFSRGARVAELGATARELSVTSALVAVLAVSFIGLEAVRLRRLWALGHPPRPRGGTWILCALVLAVFVGDVRFHWDYTAQRDRTRHELESQFALFAALDPPVAEELPSADFPTHFAPVLQVTRDLVALNGQGISSLAAMEGGEGRSLLVRDVMHAVGEAGRQRSETATPRPERPVELALTVTQELPFARVASLLALAHQAGVRTAELRLMREPRPDIPRGAPPEAEYVLPRDFVALPVELAPEGYEAAPDASYAESVRELVARARGGERVVVAVSP